MNCAQYCPIAKASEVIGERWMLLVVRELISGASSFTELQRGLGIISPSVLSSRIQTLVEHGIVERLESAPKGRRYRLTQSGSELAPIIEAIGSWGQRWVRSRMTRAELGVELAHGTPLATPLAIWWHGNTPDAIGEEWTGVTLNAG